SMFSSRGYTTGMFFGKQPDGDYNFDGESYRMSHELVGVIVEAKRGVAKVSLRNRLDVGDAVEYLTPGLEGNFFVIDFMRDGDGIDILSARNEETVFMRVPEGVRENDLIRREKSFGPSGRTKSSAPVKAVAHRPSAR
ncbi:MAG TPA: U32 family peptidase C-terminal domain-containing protein, partial [Thermodesulfovibrionales bacterium]|nr:U32 family peptidase C-terminal domain-containing protein [Thermodesulfovibrionales bacterium]